MCGYFGIVHTGPLSDSEVCFIDVLAVDATEQFESDPSFGMEMTSERQSDSVVVHCAAPPVAVPVEQRLLLHDSAPPLMAPGAKRARLSKRRTSDDLTLQAMSLFDMPAQPLLDVRGCGPTAALGRLVDVVPVCPALREDWLQQARSAAVLGSCPRSRDSMRSGLRNWINFVSIATRDTERPFPPDFGLVITWCHTFRCLGTYCNYPGHLRSVCHALGIVGPPVAHPAIGRAKSAIVKRMVFSPRQVFA